MKLAIHQPQYMPWCGYFHKIASCDRFVFLNDVQFKKNEWQHRNRIRNAQGWQWLTVPTGYRFPQKINEVQVRNQTGWYTKHGKTLEACYRRAPYFERYYPEIRKVLTGDHQTIDRLNIAVTQCIMKAVGITTPCEVSSDHEFEGVSSARLISICRFFGADTYLAGSGGKNYMDLELFARASITVEFQEFHLAPYPQLFCSRPEEFIPTLSALDCLFNCGPRTYTLLTRQPDHSRTPPQSGATQ